LLPLWSGAITEVITMKYDEAYDNTDHVFGREPETILVKYHTSMNPDRPVLDIGAGQGRHALYLARQGFKVDAVDPSRVGINTIASAAAAGQLPVTAHNCTIDQFPDVDGAYSGVLLFGLIQELSRESIPQLVLKIDRLLQAGGVLFVTAFSTKDPAYKTHAAEWERIGKHSYQNESGTIRTYLEPDEILSIFSDYEVVYHREELGPEHRHGAGPLQRHFRIEFVGRKPSISGR
jgi:tellurite methyltransferase